MIPAVDYMVYADQSQRLAMRVKYQLEEFGRNSPVVLRVPVREEDWIKGLDSCLVDGRPQQPTRATDRPMLLLPLSESAEPADAATGDVGMKSYWKLAAA
ncbi:MAG: hypothetical protein U0872_12075 [Planctomycetaceae bacterium]